MLHVRKFHTSTGFLLFPQMQRQRWNSGTQMHQPITWKSHKLAWTPWWRRRWKRNIPRTRSKLQSSCSGRLPNPGSGGRNSDTDESQNGNRNAGHSDQYSHCDVNIASSKLTIMTQHLIYISHRYQPSCDAVEILRNLTTQILIESPAELKTVLF